MQGDPEANLVHFALQKLHIRPRVLTGDCSANEPVSHKERAFIYASILVRVEKEKEEARKMRNKGGKR